VITKSETANIICGWYNNNLLGILGYVPLPMSFGKNNQIDSVWTLYWMVDKNAPKGLGFLLLKRIKELFTFIGTVNASKLGVTLLKSQGWRFYPRIPRNIVVFDKIKCINMLFNGGKDSDLENFLYRPNKKIKSEFKAPDINDENYKPDWNLYPNLSLGVVRSNKYFNWRYIKSPAFDYKIVINGEPERPAVCVYRIENAFGDSKDKVGRIVDYFFPNDQRGQEQALSLLNVVLKHFNDEGCAYSDFFCSNSSSNSIFKKLGGGLEQEKQILPVRIRPVEKKEFYQNFCILTPEGKENIIKDIEYMYITKSDIDGDGPSSNTNKIINYEREK
jgi:hypothetical protein